MAVGCKHHRSLLFRDMQTVLIPEHPVSKNPICNGGVVHGDEINSKQVSQTASARLVWGSISVSGRCAPGDGRKAEGTVGDFREGASPALEARAHHGSPSGADAQVSR